MKLSNGREKMRKKLRKTSPITNCHILRKKQKIFLLFWLKIYFLEVFFCF